MDTGEDEPSGGGDVEMASADADEGGSGAWPALTCVPELSEWLVLLLVSGVPRYVEL